MLCRLSLPYLHGTYLLWVPFLKGIGVYNLLDMLPFSMQLCVLAHLGSNTYLCRTYVAFWCTSMILPLGWEERKTPNNKTYYLNHEEKTVLLSHPDDENELPREPRSGNLETRYVLPSVKGAKTLSFDTRFLIKGMVPSREVSMHIWQPKFEVYLVNIVLLKVFLT